MLTQIPLAWLQLTREPARLAAAVAGVAFAVLLVFMQFGFSDALYASAVRFHASLRGDLFLINPQTSYLVLTRQFSRRRLYQALGFEGVESVSPVYAALALWKSPYDKSARNIFIVGFDPSDSVLDLPGLEPNRRLIRLPDMMLFDEFSRPEYGPVADELKSAKTLTLDVQHGRVSVAPSQTVSHCVARQEVGTRHRRHHAAARQGASLHGVPGDPRQPHPRHRRPHP